MLKTYLIDYHLLTGSDMQKTVSAFAKALSREDNEIEKIAFSQGALYDPSEHDVDQKGIIGAYKLGAISRDDFYAFLSPQLTHKNTQKNLSKEEFFRCWHAMCELSSETIEKLQALQRQQQKTGFNLVVLGRTNESQHEYGKYKSNNT